MLVKETDTQNYGRCMSLTAGKVTLLVTLDYGPRIASLTYDGSPNMFFTDTEDEVNKSNSLMDPSLKGMGDWHIYGGHRLWKSPEDIASYFPDNAPVKVEREGDGVRFSSAFEPSTGLVKSMYITASDDGAFKIEHRFLNGTSAPLPPVSLWALTVLAGGAVVKAPLDTSDTGLLPNRNLVLWSYNSIKDPRLTVDDDCVTVTFDSSASPMKIGLMNTLGVVRAYNHGLVFTKSWQAEQGDYPDFSCNTEIYSSHLFTEMETLSPLKALDAGECAVHTEVWTLSKE